MDFKNAKELLELSQNEKLTISEVMRQRELSETENSPEELYTKMERVLEIMKDSRLGTFGGAALFLFSSHPPSGRIHGRSDRRRSQTPFSS